MSLLINVKGFVAFLVSTDLKKNHPFYPQNSINTDTRILIHTDDVNSSAESLING